MAFYDNWFSNKKDITARQNEDLPMPTTMRRQNFLFGVGGQDLFAMLSRRLPASQRDWSATAGDLMLNSIVAISMDYYVRAFTQAVPMVYTQINDQEWEKDPKHPILPLLANPQVNMTPTRFWSNIIFDYKIYGNAYIRILRDKVGDVIGLQFLPAQQMAPWGDGTNSLTKWQYVVDGIRYDLKLDDVIHIAYGRDPIDYRLGRSPLVSTLREIATDNQASSTAWGLMNNSGLPSIMVSPDVSNENVDVSDDDLRTLKRRLADSFTGDQAGSIAVMSGPFKVEKISFSPADMALDVIRHTPEERITSALGLNCLVLNLSAGLENSTYANLKEAEQGAWNQGVIPLLKAFAEVITQSLLPEFPETRDGDYFDWDLSRITALMDDTDDLAKRAELLYVGGIIDRSEAKRMIGISYNPLDEEVYHPQASSQFIATQPVNPQPDQKSFKSSSPTASMKEEARRGLSWREEFNRGGTEVGLNRAKQISAGESLSEEDILDMYSFFSRHEVDKKAQGFKPNEEGYPSNGRIAWALWGGDAGYSWSKKERDKIMKEREGK